MSTNRQIAPRSWESYKKTMSSEIDIPDFRGFTPLMLAAYRGNLDELQFLIESGANPNLPDPMGNTPLMGVAFKGNVSAAQILLAAGADPRALNKAGLDAFAIASSFHRIEMTRLLSEYGIERRGVAKLTTIVKLLCVGFLSMFKNLVALLNG